HLRVDALEPGRACGAVALRGLLEAARRRGLEARCVDLRNSGDTSGSRQSVVGYGAFGFWPAEA
ncbi:MAG TPA: AmmeMemoRadiSam system protein B, partial [Longimicrobiales bacterium]|nr:AmmeMemoRadiSam system protein B [Longimicrobiales bacterium]